MKKTETSWWVVAATVALTAILVGLLVASTFGGLLPPE
jgi:hypothetical protein